MPVLDPRGEPASARSSGRDSAPVPRRALPGWKRPHSRFVPHFPDPGRPLPERIIVLMSAYDAIAALYDPWSRSVTEDVDFYVAQARKAGGPVVELGVGTGRIAVPIAKAGVRVIGIDDSESMLALCRTRAQEAGGSDLVELRLGDLRRPPVLERVRLVTCPFRALLHLSSDGERLETPSAADLVLPPRAALSLPRL